MKNNLHDIVNVIMYLYQRNIPRMIMINTIVLGICIFVTSIFVVGCSTISRITSDMTPRQEYYLGRSVMANLLTKTPLVTHAFNNYLNKVGILLSFSCSRPETYRGYHFGVVTSEKKFAVSAPGGFILISVGLLKDMESEDELAAVLAHEVAHIDANHVQKAIKSSGWTEVGVFAGMLLAQFAVKDNKFKEAMMKYENLVSEDVETVVKNGYGRGQEEESDVMALEIISRSGYDPTALLTFLKKHKSTDGDSWTSTHPSDQNRVDKVTEELTKYLSSDGKSFEKIHPFRTERFKQQKMAFLKLHTNAT
ncbi:MAG: M48 family metalloprotease [Oligoflexia bacterium]|nr:M48 family metalloprotease [Oligoflexia bacterium]